jgi:hypothetical protein
MIQPFNEIRGGIEYQIFSGEENGQNILYVESVEPIYKGLRERWYWSGLIADGNKITKNGNVRDIKTEWTRTYVFPDGSFPVSDEEPDWSTTKDSDIPEFVKGLGAALRAAFLNIWVRERMGFNHLPIIDTRPVVDGEPNVNYGKPREYSDFLKGTPRTNDYKNWHEGDPLPASIIEPTPEP